MICVDFRTYAPCSPLSNTRTVKCVLTVADKKGFLGFIARKADAADGTLYSVLIAFHDTAYERISNGKQVVATSGNGRSVSYMIPDFFKTLTQDEVRWLMVELLDTYWAALTTLGLSMPPSDNSQDSSILSAMFATDNMQRIETVQVDHTSMRYPTYGPTQ